MPRLELVAVTLSVKIALLLRDELDIEINKEYFWIDSKIVLGYISSSNKKFNTLVANRIQFIRDHSGVAEQHYVLTAHNPGDENSKVLGAIKSSK